MKAIGRNRLAKAKNLAVVAVGLLLALAFARPAPALTWEIDNVDTNGVVGLWTSIALDSSDAPHVSYFDKSNGNLTSRGQMVSCVMARRRLQPRGWE